MIYLDNAASTQPSENVKDKIKEVIDAYGNPSSIHSLGVASKAIIEDATKIIAQKINCNPYEIHYTSGATMSNCLAIHGFMQKYPSAKLVISAIEHNDIMMLYEEYKTRTYIIPVLSDGKLSLKHLSNVLDELQNDTVLVSIQMANSECGVIQPIKDISDIVHKYKKHYLHTDATQYVPYYPIDVWENNIDMLSMSGQKINCIKGIGLLYVKENLKIKSIILGEQGLIGGTENVLGIACLGQAFKDLTYDTETNICMVRKRDYLIDKLSEKGTLVGSRISRLPNNICMLFKDVDATGLVTLLNESGIYVSTGSACSSGSAEPSHVMLALGLTRDEANSCVRFTIGKDTTFDELDYVINKVFEYAELIKGWEK